MYYNILLIMVNHICPNCGEIFTKKSSYNYHINRKKPCKKITHDIALKNVQNAHKQEKEQMQKDLLFIEIKQINNDIVLKNDELIQNINKNEKKFCCKFCNQNFTRKFCLDRHLNNNCKMKLKQNENNNVNNNKFDENNEKLNLILNRLNYLENENKKLKKKIEKKTTTNNTININQSNINLNHNNLLVNFNDVNLANVDKKLFVQPILNHKLFGKAIILQMIENIYINVDCPEYHNFIITDKNRGYVKIYNNGKWKTDNINMINMVIDGIISHSKLIIIELKQQYNNNNQIKNRVNTSEKYIKLCDLEHLNNLEDQQENDDINNENEINKIKQFREMIVEGTVNLFHDNKNLLLKSKENKIIKFDN